MTDAERLTEIEAELARVRAQLAELEARLALARGSLEWATPDEPATVTHNHPPTAPPHEP